MRGSDQATLGAPVARSIGGQEGTFGVPEPGGEGPSRNNRIVCEQHDLPSVIPAPGSNARGQAPAGIHDFRSCALQSHGYRPEPAPRRLTRGPI